jgi:YidC/Oxa1 family membrane protein insertase
LNISNPLVPPLQALLEWMNAVISPHNPFPQVIGSYAIALILIAILVKLVTYPLTLTQTRSMRSMQNLQPKMAELQDRHKGDREKLAAAQMELYKEHGVNPFGGCLPLIITMVLLISIYAAIRGLTAQMSGQPFFWIQNIAVCEPNPRCTSVPYGIPILIIIMVLTQFMYQKYLTPPTADPQAKSMNSMMKFMPLMFGFFFLTVPAGLVLYYLVFNVVSIAQQLFMNRQMGAPRMQLPVPVTGAADGGSAGPAPGDGTDVQEPMTNERSDGRRRRRKKSP